MARMPPGGDYGGGYLKVQRHLRTAVMSVGFALVTITPFTADLTVPSIAQSQLTGYKYPARTVRQTEPQQGWLYTASIPFDPTVTVAPIEQSKLDGYRYPRRTVRQTEFQDGWLETAANPPFDVTVAVAPVGQSRLDGYRYPARTVRQTEPQDGWLETATHDWAVERTPYSLDTRMAGRAALTYRYDGYPATDWIYQNLPVVWDESQFQNNSGDLTPIRAALRYRYADYPGTDWIYQNLPVADVWDESKFQNISGDMTPVRPALKFRYPLASAGFSTDGSTPDAWDESKFQNISGDRTVKRRQYDPRYEYHKFSFGLLDARVVMPAIDQLANSERVAKRKSVPIVTTDSLGWIYENLPVPEVWSESKFQNISGDCTPTRKALLYRYDGYPATDWIYENLPVPFDPQYLIHSEDTRMRDRYKKVPQLEQPAQDWIYAALPPTPNLGRLFIDLDTGHLIYRITP